MSEREATMTGADGCATCGLTHEGFACPGPCPGNASGIHCWMNDDHLDGSWLTLCVDCGAVAPWDEDERTDEEEPGE